MRGAPRHRRWKLYPVNLILNPNYRRFDFDSSLCYSWDNYDQRVYKRAAQLDGQQDNGLGKLSIHRVCHRRIGTGDRPIPMDSVSGRNTGNVQRLYNWIFITEGGE